MFHVLLQSVTGFGRMMIEKSREIVEDRFSQKNGAKHDAKVHGMAEHD